MPRIPRSVVAGFPHHVVQRGHNREPVFKSDRDHATYLRYLIDAKESVPCKIYTYCLMTNHVHLVVVPPQPVDLGRFMQRVSGRYARYFNTQSGRSGSVWEDRFRSNPIAGDEYLLACGRYVDLNPVRAGVVRIPEGYRWSGYRARVGRVGFPWLDEDPALLALGRDRAERERRYREWVERSVNPPENELIRSALARGRGIGNFPGTDPNLSRTCPGTDPNLSPRGDGRR